MPDMLWLFFVAMVAFIAGWAMCGRLSRRKDGCTVDDWQACRAAMCQQCEYKTTVIAREADIAALREDISRLSHRNSTLWGYVKKMKQRMAA